jgi:xanthine/uracil/vitamin C permease (AzgA family)
MGKTTERLNFEWQKSQNMFIFSLSLLLSLFAIRNEFPKSYLMGIYLAMALLIFLAGSSYFNMVVNERTYTKELSDNRIKLSKFSQIKDWILILIALIVLIFAVYLALSIWQVFFINSFYK